MPRAPCPSRRPSVRPARSHSLPVERLLPGPLRHPPLPGVSLFRHFRCYLDLPPIPYGPLRNSSLPGVSLFRHFRSYLDLPPIPYGPPRHPPLPGVSLFRHFRCYLGRPHALQSLLRLPSLPGVSRFRRIGSHLRRVTQAPRPGAMAAGAQEQAASCDAFVLSRRLPAPGAPPIGTSPACPIAKAPSNSRRTTAR